MKRNASVLMRQMNMEPIIKRKTLYTNAHIRNLEIWYC